MFVMKRMNGKCICLSDRIHNLLPKEQCFLHRHWLSKMLYAQETPLFWFLSQRRVRKRETRSPKPNQRDFLIQKEVDNDLRGASCVDWTWHFFPSKTLAFFGDFYYYFQTASKILNKRCFWLPWKRRKTSVQLLDYLLKRKRICERSNTRSPPITKDQFINKIRSLNWLKHTVSLLLFSSLSTNWWTVNQRV